MTSSGKDIQNLVVARFKDGSTIKGTTLDFFPAHEFFHVMPVDNPNGETSRIFREDLKAVFFVKTLDGNPDRENIQPLDAPKPPSERLTIVEFMDNEIIIGATMGYSADRPGFFLSPLVKEDNNKRIFVVKSAIRNLKVLLLNESLAKVYNSLLEKSE